MGYYDSYLEHHGILGQKWGVRRFENKNGHLTAAGKKRYDGDKVSDKEKHAFSAKAVGWKALSKTQAMNAKVYDKLGNKSMANIQKTVSKQSNQLAEKAQKEADARKAEKEAVKSEKKGLTDKQKKVIIAGAAVVGTALAAYGGYKLYQLNKQATEGISKEYHSKAKEKNEASWDYFKLQAEPLKNATNYQNSNLPDSIKKSGYADAMSRAVEYKRKSDSLLKESRELDAKAKAKNYSVKEKVEYLKTAKNARRTPSMADLNRAQSILKNGSGKKVDLSEELFGKTSSAPRNTPSMDSLKRAQDVLRNGKNTTTTVTKIAGQTKFEQAAKANDDLVQELLKKNTIRF